MSAAEVPIDLDGPPVCWSRCRPPGAISCYDICELTAQHSGLHQRTYGSEVRSWSDDAASASFAMSPSNWLRVLTGRAPVDRPSVLARLLGLL